MSITGSFSDLKLRIISGVCLAAIGLLAIGLGGWVLMVLGMLVILGLLYELVQLDGENFSALKVIALIFGVAAYWAGLFSLDNLAFGLLIGVGVSFVSEGAKGIRILQAFAAIGAIFAIYSFIILRSELQPLTFIALIGVVVAADIAAYFTGRMIGGPKVWPQLSPKKTWSGIIGGLIAGSLIGALGLTEIIPRWLDAGVLGFALAAASQIGDFFFSYLKRRVGKKDYSNLIPGHGGFGDRFDGFIGAGVLLAIISYVLGLISFTLGLG